MSASAESRVQSAGRPVSRGLIGLDFAAVKVALDFAGIAVTLRLWGEMRLIEAGALQVMRGNS